MSLSSEGGKKLPQLTSRQKHIIELIAKLSGSAPITVAELSGKMNLSSRTILREMPSVEKWLAANSFTFTKKPGVGLTLNESLEGQRRLLELLNAQSAGADYTKDERRRLILVELLDADGPIKSGYFTKKYRISEGTLSTDLDYLADKLKPDCLSLIRKQGVGISLSGSEEGFRRAIAGTIYDCLGESEILSLLKGEDRTGLKIDPQNRLIGFIDRETASKIEKILFSVEKKLRLKYSDSAYMALLVHISLAVKRIANGESIIMEQAQLQKLQILPEYFAAAEISREIEEAFSIKIPPDEEGYITMHLLSAKIWMNDAPPIIRSMDARAIALKISSQIEAALGVSFTDSSLIDDLCSHLPPALNRIGMNISIKNSQLDTIRTKYKKIFQATADACSILKEICGAENIPDEETAFIAMHFCAAIEKQRASDSIKSAVVVCPTGIGSSRLLAAGLQKEFPGLEIRGVISALAINTDELIQQGVDIIISTVDLDVDYNHVRVNPVLGERDREAIEKRLNIKVVSTAGPSRPVARPSTFFGRNDIINTISIGNEILELLNGIRLLNINFAENRSEIIAAAAAMFSQTPEDAAIIQAGLENREKTGGTYIDGLGMLLLHCKTSAVDHCRFGYISLGAPLKEGGASIVGAIVMLAPVFRDSMYANIMGAVSGALIDNERIALGLRTKSRALAIGELERSLGEYFLSALIK